MATTQTGYFNAQRYATLVRLCQLVGPSTQGYPSAVDAGAPQFLDFLIGGSPADRQAMYNDGLDRLNADSMKMNKVSFDKTDARQADAVIRPHLKGWINDHPPTEKHQKFVALSQRDIEITQTIDATTLLEKVHKKQYSAEEVATAFIKRATLAHRLTNCLMDVDFETGLERAKGLDHYLETTGEIVGPLHGLPISIKVRLKLHEKSVIPY